MNTLRLGTLWCPQHSCTEAQLKQLPPNPVTKLSDENPTLFKELSSLDGDSNLDKLTDELINEMTKHTHVVLPIGSPAFMFLLSYKLSKMSFTTKTILFAHSKRESKEMTSPDGEVTKVSRFVHEKFIVFSL